MKCKQCADTCLEFQRIDAEYVASFSCKNCDSSTTKHIDVDQVKANIPCMAKFIDKGDVFRLMLRNGVCPYEYMDGWQRFEETKLPPKEVFFSNLNMKGISDNDYEHAHKVWRRIAPEGSKVTMGDYHDAYLTTDVLLLADVFEIFRSVCPENYKLDPAHFYSAPGVAWKAAPKYTEIKLDLLTDPNMLVTFERGIRGGITQAVHRYAKANNKYMGDQYDPNEESPYLYYLDANNFYGCAMREDLPTDGFKWVLNVEAFTEKRFEKLLDDKKHGYILEVDINYPEKLHDKHNELPFLPERKLVHKVEKLIPKLEHRQRHVVHIRAHHEALKHGLQLKKVYRVIQFNQKPWLKDYIDHNRLRMAAKNEFEKDFYQLMNLSVFGKTMENLRSHRNIQFVTNEKKYTKLVMKPNFKGENYFSSHLMGVDMGKTEEKMNKPVHIGQALLEMSKIVMYEFHYDYMQPQYGSKLRVCYMDTDSFVYHIRTEDFYRDIADDVETRFDTSAYSKDDGRPLPIGKNKKVVS
ncbi:uncharacterized protein LOC130612992 [Hydractinia symbiolongicarpus]|uniref:uncharacterized protein LOC130612992 n=1 Tax=Hydractinia symbiolongicarpus TaxID=13093 RepID=UPI00254C232C|nr:uncharacterized protein LOC130612992 [Hydractinia symbiolongicarpus]